MKHQTYRELAKYYDDIYAWKDYRTEARILHELIRRVKKSRGRELLDVACGTGNHIPHLVDRYEVTGLDLNAPMLAIARKKFPEIAFHKADMTRFNLRKTFDAVVCLFSAIGHLRSYRELELAINCMARHLKPGGVLVLEPFLTPGSYKTGSTHAVSVTREDYKLTRMNVARRKGNKAVLDFHYLIATPKGVKHLRDYEELFLFEKTKVLALLRKAGLTRATYLSEGLTRNRGLYVATKPLH